VVAYAEVAEVATVVVFLEWFGKLWADSREVNYSRRQAVRASQSGLRLG
jgi:hypothetical protein